MSQVSPLFYSEMYKSVESGVQELLNDQEVFLSERTVNSTRAVGDAIESIVASGLQPLLGDLPLDYSSDFARRAMADVAFHDVHGFYYVVDVKTHRTDTSFNMPNLTSVRRLARFYEDDSNYFAILMATYRIDGVQVAVESVRFVPIEFLGWDCLTLGALGWGQLQIANANNVTINDKYSRKKWMLELCDNVQEFYEKEVGKIATRIDFFDDIRTTWSEKLDIWSVH